MALETQLEVRALDAAGIDEARAFAYEAYVLGEGWRIAPDDAGGLRIVDGDRPMLVGRFDDCSTWFGVFEGAQMVGCTRATSRLDGALDADVYPEAASIRAVTQRYPRLVEWSRSIIRPSHRGKGLFPILCRTALEQARRTGHSVLTTTRLDSVVAALTAFSFPESSEAAIKYDGYEGTYRVFLADLDKGEVDRVLAAVSLKIDSLASRGIRVRWAG